MQIIFTSTANARKFLLLRNVKATELRPTERTVDTLKIHKNTQRFTMDSFSLLFRFLLISILRNERSLYYVPIYYKSSIV